MPVGRRQPRSVVETQTAPRPAKTWPTIAAVTAVAFVLPLRAVLHARARRWKRASCSSSPIGCCTAQVANKDFFYLYGPGSLWMLAAIYKVFGVHILVERAVGLAQLVGVAVGAAAIVRWWGRWVAAAAIVLSVMFVMPSLQLTAIPYTGRRRDRAGFARGVGAGPPRLGQRRRTSGATVGDRRRYGGRSRDAVPDRPCACGASSRGRPRLWGLPRPLVRRALAGLALGVSPVCVAGCARWAGHGVARA